MKIKRKNVFIRDDCFEASERGASVKIEAFRNVVQITTSAGYMECKLDVLEEILNEGISRAIQSEDSK